MLCWRRHRKFRNVLQPPGHTFCFCRPVPRPRSIRQSHALRPICPQHPELIWRMFPGRCRSVAGTLSIAQLLWPTAPRRQLKLFRVRGAISPQFTTAASGRSCSCFRGRGVSMHGWGPGFTRTRPSTVRRLTSVRACSSLISGSTSVQSLRAHTPESMKRGLPNRRFSYASTRSPSFG